MDFKDLFKFMCFVLLFPLASHTGEFEEQVNEMVWQQKASMEQADQLLGEKARAVPIILPVSNPTVGTGLAGGALYMHGQDAGRTNKQTTMTGVFGMYTSTESWAFGGFHDGSYLNDRLRIRIPAAHGDFNLDFYGVGDNSPLRDDPIEYRAIGNLFVPEASFELPIDNWYLGGQYRIIDIKTSFGSATLPDDIPGLNAHQKTAGFGLVTMFDNRDSNLWPTRGSYLDVTAGLNGEYAGGDYNYFRLISKWAQYFSLNESLILIYRLDGQYLEGTAPFWDLARIRLRGFSSGQYLDNVAATGQAELRWTPVQRWTLSAFGGAGRIADKISDMGSAPNNVAGGAGFRYMLVEDQKLSLGLDVAYTDDSDFVVYFQIGDWLAN